MKTLTVIVALGLIGVVVGTGAMAMASVRHSDVPSGTDLAARFAPAAGEAPTVHRKVAIDGGEWLFTSHRNDAGDICINQTVPGEATGTTCIASSNLFADGSAIVALPGARQLETGGPGWDNMWIHGFARASVMSLELVSMDCSAEAVQLDSAHAFMHVVSKDEIGNGTIPYKIVARDASGRVIEERDVSMNLPPTARRAGLTAPVPGKDCR